MSWLLAACVLTSSPSIMPAADPPQWAMPPSTNESALRGTSSKPAAARVAATRPAHELPCARPGGGPGSQRHHRGAGMPSCSVSGQLGRRARTVMPRPMLELRGLNTSRNIERRLAVPVHIRPRARGLRRRLDVPRTSHSRRPGHSSGTRCGPKVRLHALGSIWPNAAAWKRSVRTTDASSTAQLPAQRSPAVASPHARSGVRSSPCSSPAGDSRSRRPARYKRRASGSSRLKATN